MKILVCGGRYFHNQSALNSILNECLSKYGQFTLIEGGARGADSLARTWAILNMVPYLEFKADWDMYGLAAGPIRNRRMLVEGKPDLVIAFPGGKGTDNMVSQALGEKITVVRVAV